MHRVGRAGAAAGYVGGVGLIARVARPVGRFNRSDVPLSRLYAAESFSRAGTSACPVAGGNGLQADVMRERRVARMMRRSRGHGPGHGPSHLDEADLG